MKKIISLFLLVFFSLQLKAQETIEMADKLRADGKIYVVVAVVSTVLLGILLYIIRLDIKLTKLEKEYKSDVD